MNKSNLLRALTELLENELAGALREAQATIAAATDPDSKAENKYDTRSLEASYLARGQSQRVAELEAALDAFRALALPTPTHGSGAVLGSLVTATTPQGPRHFFLGPSGGGTEIECEGKTVLVLTPHSPLGGRLLGRRPGEPFPSPSGAMWRIESVV